MKYFATFGSSQLDDFDINPMSVMVGIPKAKEMELRTRLQQEPFNNRYCTTYPILRAKRMEQEFNMKLYTLDELLEYKREK